VRFDIEDVDLRGALKALTDSTNTFVFPLSPNTIFVARDTPQKRDEYEPQVSVSVPLPEIVDDKSTSEISNAVRQAFDLRHIGMDSVARTIVIRDKISRANAARVLLESLVRPKAQIAVEVKILSVDDQSNLRYGLSLPTTFPMVNFGNFGISKALVAIPAGFVNFITFGGGATLFGIGVTDVQAIATYSKALSKNFFDTTVVVSAGETAQMHVGDKYPVAQSLYTGSSQFDKALYGPPPQIQMVDLGILVKVKPELHADGDITMEVHAEYQALGTRTLNTVPEILNRQFDGTVRLRSGELAVVAGLDSQTSSVSKNGVAGLSEIPSAGELFAVTTRTHANSKLLMLIEPHPTRDSPLTDQASYYVGGEYGRKVLL
jgi:general secretion pathway protein D